jgi:hypothetical protein
MQEKYYRHALSMERLNATVSVSLPIGSGDILIPVWGMWQCADSGAHY